MRRAQAHKKGRTVIQRIIDLYRERVGLGFRGTAGLITVTFVIVLGVVNHVSGGADESIADQLSYIPDNISADCHAKLVRSYFRETTVDRYERQEMEEALKSGDNCQQ